MAFKTFSKYAVSIIILFASCGDKKQGFLETPDKKPPIETIDPVSTIIKKNSTLIKTVVSDVSYSNHPGMTETYISYINPQDKPIALYILQIDLSIEDLSIEVATPNDKPIVNSTQKVSAMITAKNNAFSSKQVIAGINGDYFDSPGIPLGPVHKQGVQVKTAMSSGYKYFGTVDYKNYIIGDNAEYLTYQNRLQEVMGGRHQLLKNGIAVIQTDVSVAPRTSIGLITPKKMVIMVVDGRQPTHSVGYTLAEEAEALKALGVKDAVNLDGGGSSVFITKDKDSQYKIKNKVSDGSERTVANGLFVMQKKK